MNKNYISEKLKSFGFRIKADEIKYSEYWTSVNLKGSSSKLGHYIIKGNICKYINDCTGDSGTFIIDKKKIGSLYDLKTRINLLNGFELHSKGDLLRALNDKYQTLKTSAYHINPYFMNKGFSTSCVGKITKDGKLIVPLERIKKNAIGGITTEIKTFLYVLPCGTNLFEKGFSKKYGMVLIGLEEIIDNQIAPKTILITKDIVTAFTIREATNLPVVAALHLGNFEPTIKSLIKYFPNTNLTICSDNETSSEELIGKNLSLDISRYCQHKFDSHNIRVVYPRFSNYSFNKTDGNFNDLYKVTNNFALIKEIILFENIMLKSEIEQLINKLISLYPSKTQKIRNTFIKFLSINKIDIATIRYINRLSLVNLILSEIKKDDVRELSIKPSPEKSK